MGWFVFPIAAGTGLALIVIGAQPLASRVLRRSPSARLTNGARFVAAAGWLVGAANAISLPGDEIFASTGATAALAAALFVLGAAALASSVIRPVFGGHVTRLVRLLARYSPELGFVFVAIALGLSRPTMQVLIAVGAIAAAAAATAYIVAAAPLIYRRAPIGRD